jgi:hypothetical protein
MKRYTPDEYDSEEYLQHVAQHEHIGKIVLMGIGFALCLVFWPIVLLFCIVKNSN